MKRLFAAMAALMLVGGIAVAEDTPDYDGVYAGYAFGNDPGEPGDTFGDLMSDLAQLGYTDANADGQDHFPNENASARAAWADRLRALGVSVQDKVQEGLD